MPAKDKVIPATFPNNLVTEANLLQDFSHSIFHYHAFLQLTLHILLIYMYNELESRIPQGKLQCNALTHLRRC